MPTDNWLETRKAVVAHLIAGVPLGLVDTSEKIWGEVPPAKIGWPFIRLGFQISAPFEAQGWSGAVHRMSIHCFAKGNDTNGVSAIAAAVVRRLDSLEMPDALRVVDLQWIANNTIRDTDETSAFHTICDFDITVA